MKVIPDGAVQVYQSEGRMTATIRVCCGFSAVGEKGLTVLAGHVEG